MIYNYTQKELKQLKATNFKNNDIIIVGKYTINIKQEKYSTPYFESYTEKNYKTLNCTPGIELPYYISDFLSR